MATFKTLLLKIRSLTRRGRVEREMQAELRFHLEQEIEERVRAGMPRDEAQAATLKAFGSVSHVEDACRDTFGMRLLDSLAQDIRYALRSFRRSPGFTIVAVLTLAIGIGANAAMFTLIDALLLRWLPVAAPEQLIALTRIQGAQSGENFSLPQLRRFAEQDDIFSTIAAFSHDTTFHVGPLDRLERTGGTWVSGRYYEMLGLLPAAGRLLTPDDDRAGATPAAVISDGYWERIFGRSGDVVGSTLPIEGLPVTIVGVSPPGFVGASVGEAADITLALSVLPQLKPEEASMLGPGGRWLRIVGRLRDGVSPDQATARLTVIWLQMVSASLSPAASPEARRTALAAVIGLRSAATGTSSLRAQFQKPLLLLMAFVALVLAIACANVANLLLARATARQREISVRLAIGAGRGRIVRQLLTESAVLAAGGLAVGIAVASIGSHAIVGLISSPDSPVALDTSPNWQILAFAGLVAAATTVIFGLAPAYRSTGGSAALATALNTSSTRITGTRARLGQALVVGQVALSLILLVGAGLFVRTLWNLRTFDTGFRHEGVLLVTVDARRAGYDTPRLKAFNLDTLTAVEHLPGVRSASLSVVPPLLGGGISLVVDVNGKRIRGAIGGESPVNVVGPRYFETLGTPVLRGREFTAQDDAIAAGVVVVNETFVRRYMPEGDPLAQRVSVIGLGPLSSRDAQVVGVVKDAVYERPRDAPPPTVYAPYAQMGNGDVTLEIYASGSIAQVASAVRTAIQPKLPASAPLTIRTMNAQLEVHLAQERLLATLGTTFGAMALGLAAIGLYGLLNYTVARRANEIGIRVALGARRGQVLWVVLRDAVRMLVLGTLIGLPIAWGVSRLMSSLLFGLSPTDPATMASAAALLVAVGLAAGYLPARRATRVDPLVALRCE